MLNWFANRRRPDSADGFVFQWWLLRLAGWVVSLNCVYKSDEDDDFRPQTATILWLVLKGSYLARIRKDRMMLLDEVGAPAYRLVPRNTQINIELLPSRNFDEGWIKFNWMRPTEYVFAADRPVWVLAVHRE